MTRTAAHQPGRPHVLTAHPPGSAPGHGRSPGRAARVLVSLTAVPALVLAVAPTASAVVPADLDTCYGTTYDITPIPTAPADGTAADPVGITDYCVVYDQDAPGGYRFFWAPPGGGRPAAGTTYTLTLTGSDGRSRDVPAGNQQFVDVGNIPGDGTYTARIVATNADGDAVTSEVLRPFTTRAQADAPLGATVTNAPDPGGDDVTVTVPVEALNSLGSAIGVYAFEVDRDDDGDTLDEGESHWVRIDQDTGPTVSTTFRDLPVKGGAYTLRVRSIAFPEGRSQDSYSSLVTATVSRSTPYVVPGVTGVDVEQGTVYDGASRPEVPGFTFTWDTGDEADDTSYDVRIDGVDVPALSTEDSPVTATAASLALTPGPHTVSVRRVVDTVLGAYSAPVTFVVPAATPPVVAPPVVAPPVTTPPPTATPIPGDLPGAPVRNPDGSSTYTRPDGVKVSVGGTVQALFESLGASGGVLGLPVAPERVVAGNVRVQVFQNGRVYDKPGIGAREVHGAIAARFTAGETSALSTRRLLAAPLLDELGVPTTNETRTPVKDGRYNHFENGSIYWSPSTGAQVVKGAIRDAWAARGWENSTLGFPTSEEIATRAGGVVQRFQGGLAYWTPQTGAQFVQGDFERFYRSRGWEGSGLGYPTSNEIALRAGGVVQRFQGGLLYWTRGTGAQPVEGDVQRLYASLGWENGELGYPTSGEIPLKDAGVVQRFQNALVYWTPRTGAHVVKGAFGGTYAAQGWENGRLGYPTSDEYPVSGGVRQDFQGGHLTYDAATGRVSRG